LSFVHHPAAMMSSRSIHCRTALVVFALALTGAACQTAAAPITHSQALEDRAIRRELAAINAAMAATFNRGDYLGAAHFYADDAQIIGAGGVRVTGRAAIDRYWTSMPAGATWRLDLLDAGGGRNSPWQLGRSTLVVPNRNGDSVPTTSVVDFLGVWRRQADGTLKLYIDMYVPVPRSSTSP
jgi:ketosteroid isomerase-like protein